MSDALAALAREIVALKSAISDHQRREKAAKLELDALTDAFVSVASAANVLSVKLSDGTSVGVSKRLSATGALGVKDPKYHTLVAWFGKQDEGWRRCCAPRVNVQSLAALVREHQERGAALPEGAAQYIKITEAPTVSVRAGARRAGVDDEAFSTGDDDE